MKKFLVLVMFLVNLGLITASAFATNELHIGPGLGTSCQAGLGIGCTGLFMGGTEVVPLGISPTKVDIFLQGGGGVTLQNPLLLILGVPDSAGTDGAAPSINGTLPGGGTAALASTTDDFTSSSTQGVYEFLGLADNGSKSNQFGNWHDADLAVNGMSVSEFDVFTYDINPSTQLSGPNQGVDINFSSGLAPGTFVVAWACQNCGGTNEKDFFTPFTNAGLAQDRNVPEPGTLALFGTGLLSLAGIVRRRLKK